MTVDWKSWIDGDEAGFAAADLAAGVLKKAQGTADGEEGRDFTDISS